MKTNSKTILVDADALVAFSKKDDANHKRALGMDDTFRKNGFQFVLSPHTIGETATVLSSKISQENAKRFIVQMREINYFELILPMQTHEKVDNWFFKQKKKRTSYSDCYNLALLDYFGDSLAGIFSFDKVYQKNGFKLAEDIV